MDRTSQRLLKEDREHGDVMFPLAAYWIELPAGAPVLDTHWHEEAEFFLLLEGEILFQVDTDYFMLRPGEAVFIESGDIHAAYAVKETPCRFCALVFHPDLLASAQYDTIQQTVILPLQEKRQSFPRHITSSVPWQGELLLHLERMMEAYDNKMPGFESFMKGTLLIMLSQIAPPGRSVNYSQSAGADTTKIDRLKKVILYIQDNYQEPIRTRDLSELIPMSEGQFCRFFKSMTRKTPKSFFLDTSSSRHTRHHSRERPSHDGSTCRRSHPQYSIQCGQVVRSANRHTPPTSRIWHNCRPRGIR